MVFSMLIVYFWGKYGPVLSCFFFLEKGVIFGSPLTEEGIAQIYQLIEYLHKSKTT